MYRTSLWTLAFPRPQTMKWKYNMYLSYHFFVVPWLELVGHNKNQISYHGSTKKLLEILLKWILFYSLEMDKVDKMFAT